MGLLGNGFDDPRSAANMALAAGLLRGDFAGGLLGANDAYAQATQGAARKRLSDLQMQEAQMKLDDAQRQRQFLGTLPAPTNPSMSPLYEAARAGAIPLPDYLKATMPKQIEFSKINPSDYTPDSLREATTTGDYTKLVPVRKMEVGPGGQAYDPYKIQPGQVLNDPNKPFMVGQGGSLVPNTPYQQYEISKSKAGATSVNVDTAPKAFWSDFGKSASDTLFKERDGAQAAVTVLQGVGQIRQAVQGGAFQGSGAELKLSAAKALNSLGASIDPKTVANSELFNASAKQFVLAQIKMLGANPSNADREFIEKTVPSLSTDPNALPRMLDFLEGKARQQVEGFNSKIRGVQQQPGAGFMPFSLEVQAPPAQSAAPAVKPNYIFRDGKLVPAN